MEHTTYPPTDGRTLAERRRAAGVTQDEVAARLTTTRQALGRLERNPAVSYIRTQRYLAALAAEVKAKLPESVA